jgi:hypothetical protein
MAFPPSCGSVAPTTAILIAEFDLTKNMALLRLGDDELLEPRGLSRYRYDSQSINCRVLNFAPESS